MILNELGIAPEPVNATLVVKAAAVAVAFGIGGKDFAARSLKKPEEQSEEKIGQT